MCLFCDNVTLKLFCENVTGVKWKDDIINESETKNPIACSPKFNRGQDAH
jgi:hypothetical protein